ncbi:MAG: phage head closure protein [Robiginitomaculum sp.]
MIGDLRTRIGIYVPQSVPDDLGGAKTNWVLYGQAWAHVKPSTTAERSEFGRAVITKTYRITIRWQRDFPERVRLLWDDNILRVLASSDPDNRRERLHLVCEEEEQ